MGVRTGQKDLENAQTGPVEGGLGPESVHLEAGLGSNGPQWPETAGRLPGQVIKGPTVQGYFWDMQVGAFEARTIPPNTVLYA